MKQGILIFGSSGSGKTTLGKMVARRLKISFVDIDDYLWRKDTALPFSVMYSQEEKIHRLMDAISGKDRFVMAGSMNSFHEYFDPYFVLAVYLTAPVEVCVARVHQREYEKFGERIQKGGDMYESHQRFLDDVANYQSGMAALHAKWADSLRCQVLKLDGTKDLSKNADVICERYRTICDVSGNQ